MMKKVLTFMLTAVMILGLNAPVMARADDTEPITVSGESGSGADVLAKMENDNKTKPDGFDTDTIDPYNSKKDEAFTILENMELFQLESYDLDDSKKKWLKTGFGEGQSNGSVSVPMGNSILGEGDILSFMQGVSFDPTNSGRRNYIALVGYDGNSSSPSVKVHIINAETKKKVQTLTIASGDGIAWMQKTAKDKKNEKGIDLVDSMNFFQITAGDYDSDGHDSVIIYCGNITDHTKNGLVEITCSSSGTFSSKDIPAEGILNPSYMAGSSSKQYNRDTDDIGSRLGVSLASGDVNGDGIDDLVAVSAAGRLGDNNYMSRMLEAGRARWPYLSVAFGNTGSAFSNKRGEYVEQKTDKAINDKYTGYPWYRTLISAGVAVGDIDGDGENEIATAGFLNYRRYDRQPLNYERNKAGFAYYKCSGTGSSAKLSRASDIIELSGDNLSAISRGDSVRIDKDDPENRVSQQFSVECVAFDGVHSKEYIFLNGYVYRLDYSNNKPSLTKVCDSYFNNLITKIGGIGDVNENFIYSAAVGNFYNDNEKGTEAITVMVGYKENDNLDYSFRRITLRKSNGSFSATGTSDLILDNRGDKYAQRLNCIAVAVDTDYDSVVGKYKGKDFAYTDPNVIAFLQAAPYFSEMEAGNSSTTYSYTESMTTGTGSATETSYNIGTTASAGAGPVTVSMRAGYAYSLSEEYEKSRTQEYTTTFEANDKNQVILRRTLIYFYYYDLMDTSGKFKTDSNKTDKSNVLVVSVPQYPVMSSLSMDQYDEFAAAYNAKYASNNKRIGQSSANHSLGVISNLKKDYYLNNEGNPFNYTDSETRLPNGLDLCKNQWMELSHAGGTTRLDYTAAEEESYTKTTSDGLYAEMSVEVGFDGIFGVGSVSAGVEAGYEKNWSQGISKSQMTSVGSGGAVQGLDQDCMDYNFSWKLIGWKPSSGAFKDIPFIGYAVKNTSAPAEPVTDLNAVYTAETDSADKTKTKETVTLTWTAPEESENRSAISGFEIYDLSDESKPLATVTNKGAGQEHTYTIDVTGSNEKEATYAIKSINKDTGGKSGNSIYSNEAHCLFAVSAKEAKALISAAQGSLDTSIEELKNADAANAAAIQKAITDLTAAYKAADDVLKGELGDDLDAEVAKLNQSMANARTELEAKIVEVQTNLDDAVKTLNQTIADGDKANADALTKAVTDLTSAYTAADAAINADITGIRGDVAAINTNIEALKSSVNSADTALQNAIDKVQENLDNATKELNDKIAAGDEANKDELNKAVSNLQNAYQAADSILNNKITALEGKTDDLKKSMEDADAALKKQIEQADAKAEEAGKKAEQAQAAADQVQANLDAAVANLNQVIASGDKTNADKLDQAVSDVIKAYTAADSLLKGDISNITEKIGALTASMNSADAALQKAIDQVQANVDQVQANLDQATENLNNAIAAGDKANTEELNKAVDEVTNAYKAADEILSSSISSLDIKTDELKKSMETADTALQSAIDQVQANVDQVQANLDQATADLNNVIAAGDAANAEALSQAVDNLTAAYTAADEALQNSTDARIDGLMESMNNANAALQNAVNTVQSNLDTAVENLNQSIARGDEENSEALNKSIAEVKNAYETADALLKEAMDAGLYDLNEETANLKSSMDEANQSLRSAIDQVQSNLDRAVTNLNLNISAGDKANAEALQKAIEESQASVNTLTRALEELSAKYDDLEKYVQTTRIVMYRLYNPNSGEHFYTASLAERDNVIRAGWRSEGVGWYAPETSMMPVYRLYNPNAGDHHYTMELAERDMLISAGWKYEGIGWYSADADKGIPLYRQYNPNAKTGTHNYTTSKNENDYLVSVGWRGEGIGWYGMK